MADYRDKLNEQETPSIVQEPVVSQTGERTKIAFRRL